MKTTAEVLKEELVDRIAEEVRGKLPGPEAAAAERFVRRYYASVPPDDVLTGHRTNLLGAALALWRFGGSRAPHTVKIRLYNPAFEEHGWQSEHTVVEIVNDDMPFLVDSVVGELNRRELTVHLVVHPTLRVVRDERGELDEGAMAAEVSPSEGLVESYMHIEIDQESSAEALAAIRAALEGVLADVRAAVDDWKPMRAKTRALTETVLSGASPGGPEDLEEATDFLAWLADNHFTFLGYREFDLERNDGDVRARVVEGSGLGLLRGKTADAPEEGGFPLSPETLPPGPGNLLVTVSKAGVRATVHRPVHMDYVGVRRFDPAGRVVGGASFLGLFTSGAYFSSASTIPLLRRKIQRVLERAGFTPRGHDAKVLLHVLETFPRDELFQMTEDELYETSLGVLHLQERQRLALFVRQDPAERFVSCLVYIPRDRYNTQLRERITEILSESFDGSISAFYTQVADSPLARVHLIVRTEPGKIPEYHPKQIEARLAEAARSWSDLLLEVLVERRGEEKGLALFGRYGQAFRSGYQEKFNALDASEDIERIEDLLDSGGLSMSLYRPAWASTREVHFKVFCAGPLRPLSDVLPMLEHMGLKVISEIPYEIRPQGNEEAVWMRDFELVTGDRAEIDLGAIKTNFQEAFARVWTGELESDGFNHLVVSTGLGWRQVVVLRAYGRYLRQVGVAFSQRYMAETLARNPELTRLLVELFEVRLDPGRRGEADSRVGDILRQMRRAFNSVSKLDEDRILRRYRNLVLSTLRTNFFQKGPDGRAKPYLSFKLDSREVKGLPAPRPMFEIFVYSPRMEGVHLRGGPVARGGIRWSDRQEDFRTEILGLMKAQMVKNAVIVPVGAKGGFIVKRPPVGGGREEVLQEGIECYKTLIRGMLDITDNRNGNQAIPPPDVVRRDDDDPYLVVAADKGTATFSDIANSVAAEYGFWLGDAFASGGSAGYDHKKMGITARGAWESVKRHFRELGKDIQQEAFTAVGIGDMSGDVFGNAMLLSEHTRLVGAFNHLHIFVDPDPDPAVGYRERRRLFELPRSSWSDYDMRLVSAGGGVFDRTAKSIAVTPEMAIRLGIERRSVTPNELIKALLRSEVDLLFFGGIGTFVKASDERHADTGDRQNDDLRVDAGELRCRVVGEGANLGVTQRGRIELALRGGKVNTDFIDNSGGVDTSDHEVNIKILLRDVIAKGGMTLEERNALLGAMTDEVAGLVLRDNYLQSQAITVTEAGGVALLDQQQRLMQALERAGRLDRTLESLPDDEALGERQKAGTGLTRPEIAVLLAYSKIALFQELLSSALPEDPLLVQDLLLYFPKPLREGYREALERHPLRRELIATHVTNSMVNRVGPTFVTRLAEESGLMPTDIARAYTICRDALGLRKIWAAIEALDNRVPSGLQIRMIHEVRYLLERSTLWFLRRGEHPLPILENVKAFRPGASRLLEKLDDVLPPDDLELVRQRAQELEAEGVPEELALRMASLDILGSALDIVWIARDCAYQIEDVGRVYFDVGARFGLEWLRQASEEIVAEGPWSRPALEAMREDLFAYQSELTGRVLDCSRGTAEAGDVLERWIADHQSVVTSTDRLLGELRAAGALDLAMISVATHQLRVLLGS